MGRCPGGEIEGRRPERGSGADVLWVIVGVGLVALVIAVLAGVVLSVLKSRYDGRFRPVRQEPVRQENSSRAAVGSEGGTAAGPEHAEAGSRRRQSGVEESHAEAGRPGAHAEAGRREGRAQGDGPALTADELGGPLGERATLVQFSSAFCAPCRATHRILTDVAGMVEGVRHVELDAESNLELVRRLDILRTPTVLVLDADGGLVTRASGQPRKADVIAAVGKAVPDAA